MVSAIRHKSNELKIDLPSNDVILVGHSSESAGKLLRGTVTLTLMEPMKVKTVTLLFVGKMKVAWSEGIGHHQYYHKQEKEIIEHKWQFVPIPIMDQVYKKTYTLSAGEHKWDFELLLPGSLPQSLDAEGGQVVYRLKAVVERTTFAQNIVKKQTLNIVRCMLPSELGLIQTLEIHNTWTEKMMYDILLPAKVYSRGHNIPITFHITPIAAKLRVRSLTCTLKEYCTYTANDCSKTDTRVVKLQRREEPFYNEPMRTEESLEHITWTKLITLDVPPMNSQTAFCDAENDLIRIRHKLKFVICLVNADGHLSELRCSVPVVIISSIAEQAEQNTLPAYSQTWRTALCVESSQERQSVTGDTSPIPVTAPRADDSPHPPNVNNLAIEDLPLESPGREPLWWNGTNISRVPSYRSAASQDPVPFSSSLPSYDQLARSPRAAAMMEQLSMSPGQAAL